MSDCTRSLDDLFEADLEDLRGTSDTETGRHVRDCMRCRVLAQRVLESTARLDTALATMPGGFDVNAVLARAKEPEATPQAATISPIRRHWQRIATVALAASIVGLLVLGDRDEALPGIAFTPGLTAELPIVEPSIGQNVAVIKTDNPDITVLWFY